jgi:hypothetical protein
MVNLLALLMVIAGGLAYFFHQAYTASQGQVASMKASLERFQNPRVQEIRAERPKLAEMIAQETEDLASYPPETPMHIFKTALISELRLTDTILAQQAAALESGAPVTVQVPASAPDPALAKNLETELEKLTALINQRTEASQGAEGDAAAALASELGTLHFAKALVIRNYLTAKYGLNSVFSGQSARSLPVEAAAGPPAPATPAAPPAAAAEPAPPQAAPAAAPEAPPAPAVQAVKTAADVVGQNSEWKVQGNWASRMSGSGSGLAVQVMRLASVHHAEIDGVPQQASLFVSCEADKTAMLVAFGLPLEVNSGKVRVEYTIDGRNPVTEEWAATPEKRGIFVPKPIPLLRNMAGAQVITFRVPYQDGKPIGTIFHLDGLSGALRPVQNACNWK